MPKFCIILNGPPGSGKDTLCKLILPYITAQHIEFKTVLYKETLKYFNLASKYTVHFIDRSLKDTPSPYFEGLTPREALIHVSEEIIKPLYGKDYFGKIVAKEVEEGFGVVNIFTDGGFEAEVEELKKVSRVLIVQLHKEGLDFSKDSRNYLENGDEVVKINVREGHQHENAEELTNHIYSFVKGGI